MGVNQKRRFVLSGVPGSGKTTVIESLESKGYQVFYEYSRQLIQNSLDTGSDVLPWENLDKFTREVTLKRIEQYDKAFEGKVNFYDRGIIDSAAYFLLVNQEIPEYLENAIRFHPYQTPIFLFGPWDEIYKKDQQRQESPEDLEALNKSFKEVCDRYNYPYIEVPKTDTENRIKFILEHVQSL